MTNATEARRDFFVLAMCETTFLRLQRVRGSFLCATETATRVPCCVASPPCSSEGGSRAAQSVSGASALWELQGLVFYSEWSSSQDSGNSLRGCAGVVSLFLCSAEEQVTRRSTLLFGRAVCEYGE